MESELSASPDQDELAWEAARKSDPNSVSLYIMRARALRDAGRFRDSDIVLLEAIERFPEHPAPRVVFADSAGRLQDLPEAIRRWRLMRRCFPDESAGYTGGATVLRDAGNMTEAEDLLTEAMRRFPNEVHPHLQFALMAHHRGHLDEAFARYMRVTDRFPDHPNGWIQGALLLCSTSRLQEAEALLTAGMTHCADNRELLCAFARIPVLEAPSDRDYPEALRRLAELRERYPDFAPGYLVGIDVLMGANQPDAAEQLAKLGCERLRDSRALAISYGRLALRRADWQEAIRRLTAARDRFPDDPECVGELARALAASGEAEEAEILTGDLVARFPGLIAPWFAYGDVAAIRQDWTEALRRWNDAARRFPSEEAFRRRAYEVNLRISELETNEQSAFIAVVPAPKPDPASIDQNTAELAMQFTSLGGYVLGCEFGLFQRVCGAEPLDLLRWAGMTYDNLIDALNTRFEGVGDEKNTQLLLVPGPNGRHEYCTEDRRGMMYMHSFTYDDEIPFDKMFTSSCRRIRYLRDKLVHDLEQGDKIFVWRLTQRNLLAGEIERLHDAMLAYGNNTLLYVGLENPAHPNGTVELIRPGLMVGYIDRFQMSPSGQYTSHPARTSWEAICRNAYRMWSAAPP